VPDPEVVSVERLGDAVRLLLRIQPELRWFAGHFPGTPLLPGVVQTHWAVEFGRQIFALPPRFLSMTNLKFMRLILPNTRIGLYLSYGAEMRELTFLYTEGTADCASGRVRFGE
jgi:3-hydroxymyristoyl/3-hydroxydecanoyl-(acyl carrier protein) dehydratase